MSFRTVKPCPAHNILSHTDLYFPSLLLLASIILSVGRRPRLTPVHVHSDTYSPPSAGLPPRQVTIEGLNSGLLTRTGGQYLSVSHKAKLFARSAGQEKADPELFIFVVMEILSFVLCSSTACTLLAVLPSSVRLLVKPTFWQFKLALVSSRVGLLHLSSLSFPC